MKELYYRRVSSFNQDRNATLLSQYLVVKDQPETLKTHFFEGRFENVYIEIARIKALEELMLQALEFASEILATESALLKVGFWFNEMHRGDVTTAHTHDEDDELLSAVYYINVPDCSCDLILGDVAKTNAIRITPDAGEFIFFLPSQLHSVDKHQSDQMRLSIGKKIPNNTN